MRKNAEFLSSLGLDNTKGALKKLAPAKKKPVRRGIKTKREPVEENQVLRRSARNRGEKAAGYMIDRVGAGGMVTVAIKDMSEEKARQIREELRTPVVKPRSERIPDGPLTLSSTNASAEYGTKFLETLRKLSEAAKEEGREGQEAPVPQDAMAVAERFAELSVDDEASVCKVTQERIYGLAVHPSSSAVMVAAGDKAGNLGIWNASADIPEDEEDDGVINYKPHSRPISRLQYSEDGSKLYSWSYDGNVRVMDLEKEAFSHVYKSSDKEDGWLQSGCMPVNRPDDLWTCDSEGFVQFFDIRSGNAAPRWKRKLHEKKVNTVDVSPTQEHFFATCGLDRCIQLWDRRKIKTSASAQASGGSLARLPLSRSVNSAFFNCNGEYLLATSMCNKLNLYRKPAQWAADNEDPTYSISHDNQTGRWLSVFHASWHPTQPEVFTCGSMQQPRSVEIFHTGNKGRRIMNIQGEYLTSVYSRNIFHPTLDVIVGGNASGRCLVMRKREA